MTLLVVGGFSLFSLVKVQFRLAPCWTWLDSMPFLTLHICSTATLRHTCPLVLRWHSEARLRGAGMAAEVHKGSPGALESKFSKYDRECRARGPAENMLAGRTTRQPPPLQKP
jgi:hypothetical protein